MTDPIHDPSFADPWTRFVRLAELCQRVVDEDRLTWEQKFAAIFCDYVSGRLYATGLMPDYYDPDMGYDDDVKAFNDAVQEKAKELRVLIEVNTPTRRGGPG